MSMLAEKRSKQKWSEDPRNTRWSEDQTKYGYRMLQRMGWSEGCGLGRGEDGRMEHVRVTRRDDNTGVGFSRGGDDGWIEHQDAFDQILAGLNAEKKDGCAAQSVCGEAQSLLSSAAKSGRVVYKKFLRSKDLSAVSSEDLDCVLGRRGKGRGKRRREEEKKKKDSSTRDAPSISHGITTITRKQSVQEYFAAKLSGIQTTRVNPSETTTDGICAVREDVTASGVCKAHTPDDDSSGGDGGVCFGGGGGGSEVCRGDGEAEKEPALAGEGGPAQKKRKRSKKHKRSKQ